MRLAALALSVALAGGCGPRNGFLEISLPFDADAEGLFAQARISALAGTAGAPAPPRLVDSTRAPHAYSVEVTAEPSAFVLEVCLCDGTEACFRADGSCRGVGATRGGLYRFVHERTAFVGERTRWTASLCPASADACPLVDPAGATMGVAVDRCAVEGCCPFCMPGRYCADPAMEVHRCE